MNKISVFLLSLSTACTQAPPSRAMPPFSVYGVWKSPAGFTLTIRPNRTYQFCDAGVCQEQIYDEVDQDELILKDFFNLPASRRFTELAEPWPQCFKAICYTLPSGTPVTPHDLAFFDSVADQDAPGICGDRECTIVGNVEAMGGLLLKQADG